MLLQCPHCLKRAEHRRSDFLGDWVVCPACELPFAWRQSQDELRRAAEKGERAGKQSESTRTKE
ncbi:MAG: hypothetical protein V3U13_07185 [Gemmatimonadota bacterium]|jgi:hypothetical protein